MDVKRVFNKVPLYQEGVSLPPSLPLVLPSNYSFDWETQQLTENKSSDRGMKYKLVPEVVKLLESIAKPVSVLSICGPYRSGKSYFLSRMLGSEETFKLGHTMEACTRGIWMASSVLECEEFVLVLLDTEGIDATDRNFNNFDISKLFILTMLLSSTFLYNSNLPRAKDFKKMSYFATSMSKLMKGKKNDCEQYGLPDFVWLLRNMQYELQDKDGKSITPTEHLNSLLKKNKSMNVSSTILEHFSNFKVYAFPPPPNPIELSDKTSFFGETMEKAVTDLKASVKAKAGCKSGNKCNGAMLASLMEQYFMLISKSTNVIPSLQVSWLRAVEIRLQKLAESLVSEYDRDMQAQLEGKFPMVEGTNGETGETLMNVHHQIFAKKCHAFREEVIKISGNSSDIADKISNFCCQIEKSDNPKNNSASMPVITGGRFFKFIQQNVECSEYHCIALYKEIYDTTVDPIVQNVLYHQVPEPIEQELIKLRAEYYERAKGPATDRIFEQLRSESLIQESELKLIPGTVQSLKVVGIDSDRVKLRWKHPDINAEAVKCFTVMIQLEQTADWHSVANRKGHSALVTGLQSNTLYSFMVLAKSEKYICSDFSSYITVTTRYSQRTHKALHTAAVVASPIFVPLIAAAGGVQHITKGIKENDPVEVLKGSIGTVSAIATSPLLAVSGAIPVVGQLISHKLYKTVDTLRKEDIESEDTEVLQWEGEHLPPTSSEATSKHDEHSDSNDNSASLIRPREDASQLSHQESDLEAKDEDTPNVTIASLQGACNYSNVEANRCGELDPPGSSDICDDELTDLEESDDENI